MRQIFAFVFLALLGSSASGAGEAAADAPDDADALSLADEAKPVARQTRNWQVFGEASLSRTSLRGGTSSADGGRLSLDLRYDGTIAPELRAVLSDRLDLSRSSEAPRETNVNTLREAYLSWHASPDLIGDVGRINLRYGAASGFNPTDYFKAGALRSIVSPDPESLRENRQGTFAVQAQKLWSGSSLTAAFSPRLGSTSTSSDSTFAFDAGATNPRNRWLLAASHKVAEEFNPQLLLHGGAGTPTQAGLNLSGLVNTATVAFLEFSIGKGRSLIAQTLGTAEPERTQRRAALGLTYTTPFNLSLTAEAEYSSAAPDHQQWKDFNESAPGNSSRLLATSVALQDLPVRQATFFYATWRDMAIRNLDLSAFIRRESVTGSRAQWIESRYRWDNVDLALRWQGYSGERKSLYGIVPQPRRVELILRYHL